MSILSAACVGLAIQAAGLGTFVLVARTAWATPGKQLVILATFCSMAALLFVANRPYTFTNSFTLSLLLALGYLLSYHVLGATVFPSLLKDFDIPSIEHTKAVAPVLGLLFLLYFVGGGLVGLLQKILSQLSPRHRRRSD